MAEAIKNEEILSDEQLDGVSGGTTAQTNHDRNLFKLIGGHGNNLVDNFAKYGISFLGDNKSDNQYAFQGKMVSQDFAHRVVKLTEQGYTDFALDPDNFISINGSHSLAATRADGRRLIFLL